MARTLRTPGVWIILALLTAACTTTVTSTSSPAGSPSPASSAPSTEAPVSTEMPTASPGETAGTTNGPTGSISPDSTFLFADEFDADAGGWGVADFGATGTIEWAAGALQFSAEDQPQGSLLSSKSLPEAPWEELALSGRFTATQGEGTLMGFFCAAGGNVGTGAIDLIGAVITPDGNWAVLAGTPESPTISAQGALPAGSVALGQEAHISVQCSVASDTQPNLIRLAVGTTIVTTTGIPAEQASIVAFDTVGLWIEATTPPMAASVDGIQVIGRHEPRRDDSASPVPSP